MEERLQNISKSHLCEFPTSLFEVSWSFSNLIYGKEFKEGVYPTDFWWVTEKNLVSKLFYHLSIYKVFQGCTHVYAK